MFWKLRQKNSPFGEFFCRKLFEKGKNYCIMKEKKGEEDV